MVMDWKTKIVKITSLHKLIFRVTANSIRISADVFSCGNQQADSKTCVKIRKSRNNQSNFEEKLI